MKSLILMVSLICFEMMANGQVPGTLYYSDGNTLHFEDLVCLKTSRSVGSNGILIRENRSLKEYHFSELKVIEIKNFKGVEPGMESASVFGVKVEILTRQDRVITDSFDHLNFVVVKITDEDTGKARRERIYFGKARAIIIKKLVFD
jgi:hypothetical protein